MRSSPQIAGVAVERRHVGSSSMHADDEPRETACSAMCGRSLTSGMTRLGKPKEGRDIFINSEEKTWTPATRGKAHGRRTRQPPPSPLSLRPGRLDNTVSCLSGLHSRPDSCFVRPWASTVAFLDLSSRPPHMAPFHLGGQRTYPRITAWTIFQP